MPLVSTPLGRLHVDDTGDGPPVLWIHAFPLAGGLWRPQVEGLGGFRHIVPDLSGFGRSTEAVAAYALDDDYFGPQGLTWLARVLR